MRRFYSLLLTAAFLLVGMNVWAGQVTVTYVTANTTAYTQNPKIFTGDYALQEAISSILPGDSANIVLNTDQSLKAVVQIPYFTGDTTNWNSTDPNVTKGEMPVRERTAQRICLDLNNHDINDDGASAGIGLFALVKGTLRLTGSGTLQTNHASASGQNNVQLSVITITGAPWGKKKTVWSQLYVDEDVFINATGGGSPSKNYGITIDCFTNGKGPSMLAKAKSGYIVKISHEAANKQAASPFGSDTCSVQTYSNGNPTKTWDAGCAYGVRLEIKGDVYGTRRGINVAGNINASPSCDEPSGTDEWYSGNKKYRRYPDPAAVSKPFYYENFYPYIKIYETADISCYPSGMSHDGNGGIYGGGYCVYDIIGANIHGQTGIMVKSGDMILDGATVASESPDAEKGGNYHESVSGTGLFITSDDGYAGDVKVILQGETKVTGNGEAAIVDVLATNNDPNETNITNLEIKEGATIVAGNAGAIELTTPTGDSKTTVTGGNIQGNVTVGGTQTAVTSLLPNTNDYHVTTIQDGENKIYIVTEGEAPTAVDAAINTWSGKVSWKHADSEVTTPMTATLGEETMGDTKVLALDELEISQAYSQIIYVEDGYTLSVDRVVLGLHAQIVVRPGGRFMVTGEQGIATVSENNVILETQEGKPAIFLIHPNVGYNRYPEATVEFISKSFVDMPNFAVQRFGIPTIGEISSIDAVDPTDATNKIRTKFGVFNYEQNKWDEIGFIHGNSGDAALNKTKLASPFEYYQMINYATEGGTKVIMKGKLVGNINASLSIRGDFWNGFANSYMAPINAERLINSIPSTVQKAFYLYDINAVQATWQPVTLDFLSDIQPLQPFLIRNSLAAANATLNYASAVYNTTVASAPARNLVNNITKAQIIVNGENSIDRVGVVESEDFSADFDNGHEIEKYMNDGINMYVSADEKMAVFATDNLENTYVGFQTVKGGNYTIEFSNVQGEELMLFDHETNAQVAMVEGNKYEFTAAANSVNDYRFEIVGAAKMPTALENTEVKANVKGIFTLTGQYLGEMNVWNSLPAGVYVVNGAKRVK